MNRKSKKTNIKIAVLALEINKAAKGFQLFPAGEFRASDDRPTDAPYWLLNNDIAAKVIAKLKSVKNDIVIDYEHQTLNSPENGQPAPAAGWWRGDSVTYDDDAGMFVNEVAWTEKARAFIESGEYRYISPVFTYDSKTGAIIEVLNAALTNFPGLDGMAPVTLSKLNSFNTSTPEINEVDYLLKLLIALLGLPTDATEEQIIAELEAIAEEFDITIDGEKSDASMTLQKLTTQLTALKTANEANKNKIAVLNQQLKSAGQADPSKYVPVDAVAALTKELNDLKQSINANEASNIISAALSDGRLTESLKAWAESLAKTDLAALKTYLDNTAPIAALTKMQTTTVDVKSGAKCSLTPEEVEIAKLTGLTVEEFAASKLKLLAASNR